MAGQRGNKWQARLRTPQKYYRYSFDTQKQAEAWEASAKLALERGEPIPDPHKVADGYAFGKFVSDNFDLLWGGTRNEASVLRLCNAMVAHFGHNTAIHTIDTLAYDSWMMECKRAGNSDGTLNRKTSAFSRVMKKARSQGYIDTLPETTWRKESQGRLRWITEDEERRLMQTFDLWGMEAEMWFSTFLLYTGARDSDAKRLEWSDIQGNKVSFFNSKNDMPRTLPMPAKAQEAIRWARAQGWERPWSGVKYNTYVKHFQRAKYHMGLGDDTQFIPYALRHTCASRLVQRGVDLRRVRDWMGHKSIKTTMIYAHLAPGDLEAATAALDDSQKTLRVVPQVVKNTA